MGSVRKKKTEVRNLKPIWLHSEGPFQMKPEDKKEQPAGRAGGKVSVRREEKLTDSRD